MKITLLASFLVMAAYFLLLYAGVGLIQEKKFFSSAPREVFAAVPERKAECFRGAHILGWCLGILAMLLFLGAAVLAAWDGVRNGFTFGAFFARYLVILYVMEAYDILFFDWVLLCHSNFFPHFTPRSRASPPRSCSGTTKKRILRTFCSTSPSPPPSRGFARFSEGRQTLLL